MNLLIATFPLAFGSISDSSVVGTFDAASQVILYWVGNAVLYGSALALLTWALLSTALRRTRPTIHAAFWVLVIAKFLLPVGPGWNYSLSSLVSNLTGWPKLEPAAIAATETESTAIGAATSMTLFLWVEPSTGTNPATAAATPAAPAAGPPRISVSAILVGAYLLGLVLIASIRLAAYRRVARAVRKLPAADAATRGVVRDVCVRLGQHGTLDVRISEAAPAPYVLGAWRPMLVLSPRNLVSREECEAVVLHELAHLRRHDLLVRYAQWLAGTVLYFWPVVAWVNRRIDLAREAACDEWALRHGRLSPAEYARCLLKCAQPVRSGLTAYAPAAMAANAKHVERRIEMILDTHTTPRRSRMLALLGGTALCGWAGFALSGASAALPSNPAEDANKTSPAPWRGAQGAPLKFFLPQVADSLDEQDVEVEEDMIFTWAGEAGAKAQHEAALVEFIKARTSDPQAFSGHWVAGDRAVAMHGAHAFAGEPHVMVMATDGKQPGVDLDGDGAVSADEHEAYLLTLAMRDPAATLARYPKADEDGDGTLSAVEASNYLSGGFMGGGEAGAFALAAPATPGAGGMFEIKLDLGDTAAGADVQPRMQLLVNKVLAEHAAAATEESVRPLIVTALAGAGAADSDKTIEVTSDVQCDDSSGVWQIAPRIKMGDGGAITLEMVTKDEASGADGAAAPTFLRMMKKVITTHGEDGQPVTTVTEQVGDEEPKVTVTHGAVDIHAADVHVAGVPILSDLPVISHLFKAHATTNLPEPPAVWLLQNAGETPSADEVRKFAGAAGDASLKRFLKMHPRSDANKDGALTVQERDAYLEKKQSRSRQRLLQRHPEADADGDGLLTSEEMRAFFKNRKHSAAAGVEEKDVLIETNAGPQGMRVRALQGGPAGPVEVKVIRSGEATEGPR